jgi:hypothetical protein
MELDEACELSCISNVLCSRSLLLRKVKSFSHTVKEKQGRVPLSLVFLPCDYSILVEAFSYIFHSCHTNLLGNIPGAIVKIER